MKGQGPIDSANSKTFEDLIISKVVEEPLREPPVGLQSDPDYAQISAKYSFGKDLDCGP